MSWLLLPCWHSAPLSGTPCSLPETSRILRGSASQWLWLPWFLWLLPSLMTSSQLFTHLLSWPFLVHIPEEGCHLFKPDHISVYWSACALPTCSLISVTPRRRLRVTWNKTGLPKGFPFSTGLGMGYFSFEEAMGIYLTCLIRKVTYKMSYASYLLTIQVNVECEFINTV